MNYTNLYDISVSHVNTEIHTYGRVHNIRKAGAFCFVILRYKLRTLQCVAHKKKIGEENFTKLLVTPKESFIHVHGILACLPSTVPKVESCFYKDFELHVTTYEDPIALSAPLPIEIDNANQLYNEVNEKTEDGRVNVGLKVRLDNRVLEMRAPMNYCIFKLQSGIVQEFRNFLVDQEFIEIHTPKTIGTSSESGSSVFELKYFDKIGYLAQSPQLYKQMAVTGDLCKVFEIGPVFRAENSVSHRHLCEFVGLDIEFALSPPYNYLEIVQTLWNTLASIFNGLETKYKEESDYLRVITKSQTLKYSTDPLIFTFSEGVKMLNEKGYKQPEMEDLSTENEKHLGDIVKENTGCDLFVLTEYPAYARPFYTMPSEKGGYSNSFDVIMRGEEICSGAQRIHNHKQLSGRLDGLGLSKENFGSYLESFSYGARPHGGCGFGLERILMLYYELKNVRVTSMFPRDPTRLTP